MMGRRTKGMWENKGWLEREVQTIYISKLWIT